MEDLLAGRLTAFVYCPLAGDAIRAIELINDFKFKAVLVVGRDAWRAAPAIGKAGLSVILPPDIVFFEEDPDTGESVQRVLPAIFGQARVSFAFQADSGSLDARNLWQVAAEAVKFGMGRKEALMAITTIPAQCIGIGQRAGQIRPGCRADLLFLNGDPLDPRTWVDRVMIDGKFVYERAKDKFLQELLEGKKQ
jgi:imidazolonepropionase-like amidohydrolase